MRSDLDGFQWHAICLLTVALQPQSLATEDTGIPCLCLRAMQTNLSSLLRLRRGVLPRASLASQGEDGTEAPQRCRCRQITGLKLRSTWPYALRMAAAYRTCGNHYHHITRAATRDVTPRANCRVAKGFKVREELRGCVSQLFAAGCC